MNIRAVVSTPRAALVLTMCAATAGSVSPAAASASAPCSPAAPGQPRTLLEKVPSLIAGEIAPTRDGGAVIALSSYRGSREFPVTRITVLALDASGCTRWRASLRGEWPIARPVQPNASSIVLAYSASPADISSLGITTLSVKTGRVLRKDVFGRLPIGGAAPTLLTDARGDVAAVFATSQPADAAGRDAPMTLRLARPAGATRWSRLVVARANFAPPAATARPDGGIAVGYPRHGRFWVRTGSLVGPLGPAADAGPITPNFRGADIALGQDGTVAAAWASTTYSRPWRLRAAVRPAKAPRFAASALLGAAPGKRGTLLTPAPPAVHLDAGGGVTVGYGVPSTSGAQQRLMCATATRADGRFAEPLEFARGESDSSSALPAMLFGRRVAASVLSAVTPAGDRIVNSVLTLGAGCALRGTAPVDPAASPIVAAMIDGRDRVWTLGQEHPSVGSRRPLVLRIG